MYSSELFVHVAQRYAHPSDVGLGDTVARLLLRAHLDKAGARLAALVLRSADCGCAQRQAALNARFPYRRG